MQSLQKFGDMIKFALLSMAEEAPSC